MFDVPLAEKSTERFEVELPDGPTDGKSAWWSALRAAARARSPASVRRPNCTQAAEWPADRAVVDCFGDLPVRQVVELFTAVGFSSPPCWIKPYHVLSCGEQFRCDLARALARFEPSDRPSPNRQKRQSLRPWPLDADRPLVVFDEFTSVVDRNVARVVLGGDCQGHPRGHIPCRFVAVTCHYDVAEWLEPDWVLDMATRAARPEASSATADRAWRSIAADWRRGNCLSVITI